MHTVAMALTSVNLHSPDSSHFPWPSLTINTDCLQIHEKTWLKRVAFVL